MSDTPETDASCGYALSSHYGRLEGSYLQMDRNGPFVHAEVARKLERERDEAQKELSSIYRWIERNHADGFIDSLTYLKNLERVMDCWYDRLDKIERERDEAREALKWIDEAIFTMKPRHIGGPDMDGLYPCWSVWLPKSGRVERKSLQDAILEFVAQIKESVK